MKNHRILNASILLCVILLVGCGDSTGPSGVTVGPGGGTASGNGVTITFPAGALENETEITFNTWVTAPSLPTGLVSLGQGVEIGPVNLTMGAMTSLEYDVSAYTGSTSIEDMAVYCYDEANQGWFWIGSNPSSDENSIGGIIPYLGNVKPVQLDTNYLNKSMNSGQGLRGSNSTTESLFNFTVTVNNSNGPVADANVEVGLAPCPDGHSGIQYVPDGTTISTSGYDYTGRSESEGWAGKYGFYTNSNGEATCMIVLRDGSFTGYWIRVSKDGEETWIAYLFWPDPSMNDSEWAVWLPGGYWGGGGGGGGNNPPNAPGSPNPSDGASNVSINEDLSWTCSDPDGDNLIYDIYFGTSSSPPLVQSGQTSTIYDPGTLSYDTQYYWKIVAEDVYSATTSGTVWNFTTEEYSGPVLWCADTTNVIYRINPNTGNVLGTFNSPGDAPYGLTWDGTYLWNADRNTDTIYKINPSTGTVISSFDSPGCMPTGLAWDGAYLWNADTYPSRIYKINPSTGNVISSITPLTGGSPHGLTWDGTNLWVTDTAGNEIYKINPSTGDVISSFDSPGGYPYGLTWDGVNLWNTDMFNAKIYQIDPITGNVIDSFDSPGYFPAGLTWQQ